MTMTETRESKLMRLFQNRKMLECIIKMTKHWISINRMLTSREEIMSKEAKV